MLAEMDKNYRQERLGNTPLSGSRGDEASLSDLDRSQIHDTTQVEMIDH